MEGFACLAPSLPNVTMVINSSDARLAVWLLAAGGKWAGVGCCVWHLLPSLVEPHTLLNHIPCTWQTWKDLPAWHDALHPHDIPSRHVWVS
jgi:hypothetical protein